MFCGHCMMDVPEKAKFCMKCGTKVGEMTCETCGAALPNGSRFCMECGAKVGKGGEKLFKVTFDRDSWGPMVSSPYRVVIDQKQRETLQNGEILEVYLTEGDHQLEISFAGKARHKGTFHVDKDILIFTKEDIVLGKFKVEIQN